MGNWTAAAHVITKWGLLHIWIKLPGGRASLSTTQSLSSYWICHTGSETLITTSLCLLNLLVAVWRTAKRWRKNWKRTRKTRRRRGIYSKRSPAGFRAPSLVCIHPVNLLHHFHPLAALPLLHFPSPQLTSQLQSSTILTLYSSSQLIVI